jgi:hypothetical protein
VKPEIVTCLAVLVNYSIKYQSNIDFKNSMQFFFYKLSMKCALFDNYAVDPAWGQWTTWSDCGVTCGEATTSRTRQCIQDANCPSGKPCPGDNSGTKDCNLPCCPGKLFIIFF